jgi:hypothetical protein
MKRTQIFKADDGTTFDTAAECRKHEERSFMHLLIGRSAKDIEVALDRTDLILANAFERAGNIIARKRREDGELKRSPKKHFRDTPNDVAMDNIKKQMKAIS